MFAKLAFLGWLLMAAAVLVMGLLAGQSSGGEVAMQMFVLTLPTSIAVGALLNEIDYPPALLKDSLLIVFVWLPFFAGGLFQALVIWAVVRFFKAKDSSNE